MKRTTGDKSKNKSSSRPKVRDLTSDIPPNQPVDKGYFATIFGVSTVDEFPFTAILQF